MSDRVHITEVNQVATVTLARAEKRNALDFDMIKAIVAAGEGLAARRDIRAVILTGDGPAFSAGLDLNAMPDLAKLAMQGEGFCKRSHGISNLFQAASMVWAQMPQPVIAAVHGYAFGGAFQIMLGADIRITAPDTRFSIMEGRWGIIPDMGGMALMRRLARTDVIRKLTFSAEEFDAPQALDWGFVTELSDTPLERARAMAADIANKSPDAIRAAKALIQETELMTWQDTLLAESRAQEKLIGQPNQMEAVMAGLAKRSPKFTD